MAVVTMRQLLESGVHFGHQTRRWNPKMKRFIFTERNGIYIIDLRQTLDYIEKAYEYVRDTVAEGGTILFVGTKKQAQEADRRAGDPGRHAVREPPLAGRHAHQLPDGLQAAAAHEGARGARRPHRHRRRVTPRRRPCSCPREKIKLTKTLGGLRDMTKLPVGDLGRRHQEGAHRRRRGPQAGHPGHRGARHQLRPGRGRLPDPGQRRRDPLGRAADPVVADAVADGLIARSGRMPRRRRRQARAGHRRPPASRCPSGSATCSRAPRRSADDGRRPPPPSRSRRAPSPPPAEPPPSIAVDRRPPNSRTRESHG